MFNIKKTKLAKEQSRKNFLIDENTSFPIKESYKSIRTNMIYSLNDIGRNVILISSSYPKEGKTTTTVNLAITFSQVQSKVLIIDADLRKPRVHKILNTESKSGFTNIILENKNIESTIIKSSYPNLDILPAGSIPKSPIEILSSQNVQSLLDELSEKYDYIFIDSPPINVVTDAVLLSSFNVGLFLVVRQGITDHRALRELMSKLSLTNVKPLGFILNDTDELKNKYKYRYRYDYKHKYRNYGDND